MSNINYNKWVNDIRKRIREKIYNELHQRYRENIEKGLYPYDGMWLTLSQIKAVQDFLKKRDKVVIIEIIFLFIVITVVSFALYCLLLLLLLPT